MTNRLLYGILLAALSFGVFVSVVKAQSASSATDSGTPEATPSASIVPSPLPPTQSLNLTVSPISVILEAKPGETVTGSMRILNNASEPEELQLELATFSADSTGSKPIIRPFAEHESHQHWLKPTEQFVTVNPGEWKTVDLTFSPPPEAALSYYYAVVVNRRATAELAEGGAVIAGAPAVLVLATVDTPNAKQELQLTTFQTSQRVYEFLPSEFSVSVKNTGNVHAAPVGNIFIDSASKKDIAILSFNQASGLVLPGSTRTYTVEWNDGFPVYETQTDQNAIVYDSAGEPIRKLSWDFSRMNKLRFGKYTAHLLMVYDNGERDVPVESTVSFWVVPWRFIAAAVAVLFFMVFGIAATVYASVTIFRSRRSKQVQQ